MQFFENLNRDFGTLGIGIVQIRFQIRTRLPRIRLYANFGKFSCIISLKNNQLSCFFGHSVCDIDVRNEGSIICSDTFLYVTKLAQRKNMRT